MILRERLGFRTSGLGSLEIEKALDLIAGAGFALVEFCMEHPGAQAYRGGLSGLGLSAVSYHGKRDDPATRRRRVARAMEKAHELGAEVAVLGSPLTDRVAPGVFLEECRWVMDNLPPGMKPAWEPEPGTVLNGMKDFFALSRVLGPEARINLDFGHAFLEGILPGRALSAAADRLAHTHIEDIDGGRHFHLAPGEGCFPWPQLAAALKESQFDGPLVADLFILPPNPGPYIHRVHRTLLEALEA